MSQWRYFFLLLFSVAILQGHVGSPDIYLDAQAGPYKLFITVRPPNVIPGVAELEIRSGSKDIRQIRAVPVPLTIAGARYAPVADQLKRSAQDAQFFTGSLWMMTSGSWQVRIEVTGAQGTGTVAVPVPSVALRTKGMDRGLGVVLAVLMILLVVGVVLIVGASVRESKLPAGREADEEGQRRARRAMALTFVLVCSVLAFGRWWWDRSEESYQLKIYKPLEMNASVTPDGVLQLKIRNPEWMNQPFRAASQNGAPMFTRVMDDFVPDHQHLMHLYAIREPGLDVVYHLHPELESIGKFRLALPEMQAGSYRLYADVVHANGFAETMTAQVSVPAGLPGGPLRGDDAAGAGSDWRTSQASTRFPLGDGYVMEWLPPAGGLHSRTGTAFRFRLVDAAGRPADQMQFYMGMLGHAAFVKTDGSAFAHVHPTGSVAMASYMMAQEALSGGSAMPPGHDMAHMAMSDEPEGGSLPNEVAFPYGFPSAGHYRIFVQMKHAGKVETGIFDASVNN